MKKLLVTATFAILSCNLYAQLDSLKTKFMLDVPLLDFPANIENNGLAFRQFSPSMQQSLGWSKSIAEIQQYYTKRLFFNPRRNYKFGEKIWREAVLASVNLTIEAIIGGTPFGTGWTHEEWHRAVMNKNNVSSFNDMNTFPVLKEIVSVSHETDEDLANFKARNNADFARMGIAGIEAQYEYVKSVQKDNFYYNLNLSSTISYWLNNLSSIQYVRICSTTEGDSLTAQLEEEEGTNIKIRDFTGLDFTAWIYDLSRPNEPYAARGISPSGVGIRRYRQTADLTEEELNYLKKMGKMQWINVISPTMFFINSIKVNNDFRFNFGLFHYLTSFGYDLGSNFFVNYKQRNVFFALHNYHNLEHNFFGIEAQLLDEQVLVGNKILLFSPSVHIWTQPKNQEFRTSDGELGAKVEIYMSTKVGKTVRPFLSLSAKTTGYVAGDVYLNSNLSSRIGVCAFIK
ncbi:MAG TPA: hypothetical protein VF691_21130 [Cytophagaceae bacterium]|jgi:hypothetical protein